MDILKNLSPRQRELLMRRLSQAAPVAEELEEAPVDSPADLPVDLPPVERIPLLPRRADGGGTFPVSFAQERFWFLDRLEPGGTAYNIPAALAMRGSLDVPVLAAALGEIVRRHEVLRTTFGLSGGAEGSPVQRVHPAPPGEQPLPVVDLSSLPRESRETAARESIAAAVDCPFDLERGPLMRVVLVRLAAAEHVAVLAMHHIASDGWSSGVLVKELGALYRAFSAREESPLPPLPCQYADFAVWQRGWLQGEVLEKKIDFWRRRLAGAAPLELPADRARPPVQTFHGALVSFTLPAGLTAAAGALGRTLGATFYMTSLAAYAALLHRLSGQDDFTVGTPHACRDRREVEGLIGPFINALTLRVDLAGALAGAPGFAALVEQMRGETLRAFAHRDVPFEKVVEELRPERTLSLPPLFQVLFNLTSTGLESLSLPGLTLSPHPYEANTAKLDLTLTLEPQGDVYGATFEYNTALFDRATVERLAGFYLRLLGAAVAAPERRVGELPLLSDAERWQLLEGWNDTASPRPRGRLIHELFAARAAAEPEAPALSQGNETLTYGELAARANRLAHHLRRLGVGPEVRVALCLERTPDLVVGLLGVLAAGGAYVPLDPGHPAERTGLVLADAAPAVLVTEEHLSGLLEPLLPRAARVVCLDRDREAIAAEREEPPERTADEENLAYVIFTSGSTGRPKGVQLPHCAVVNFLLAMAERPGLSAQDVVPALTTVTFDIAGLEIYLPLAAGGRVEMVSREEASDGRLLAARLAACGATVVQATPATWRMLLDAGWPGEPGLKALCGGEALPRDLAESLRARVAELWNVYGPTETAVWSAAGPVEEGGGAAGPIPLGAPLANTRLYTVDRSFEPVPVGVAGELWIGGAGLARGYLGRPDLTAEKFVPDPWAREAGARLYRTGDLVRRRGLGIQGSGGALEFLGRIDHQVKVRGFRIEPGEIEAALSRHPAVAQAAVVVREDGGDRRLVAYLVAREWVDVAALRSFLGESLPEYMIPAAFVSLAALPLTPSGKVDRKALQSLDARSSGAGEAGRFVPPSGPVEEVLAAVWAEILQAERVGAEDNFFSLGGHSLLATRIVSRVRAAFGVDIPLRRLFERPTVSGLARSISAAQRSASTAPPLVRRPRTGPARLSFAQERLWFLDRLDPGSIAYNLPAVLRMIGALDVAALRATLAEIGRRHESLRTTFVAGGEGPRQVIAPVLEIAVPVVDLGALPAAARQTEMLAWSAREAWRSFDLARGPLLRVTLLRLADEEWTALFNLHHIVSDAWSLDVLVREIVALYPAFHAGAFQTGKPSPLPELPVQYADFAEWQRAWLSDSETLAGQLAWWRERLQGAPALSPLPTDRPRPPVQRFRGRNVRQELPAETVAALRRLCAKEGTTLFMGVLSGLFAVLARHSAADLSDITVGTPVAGRTRVEVEDLIGLFLNTLVLRLPPASPEAAAPGFRALLARTRELTLGAFAHQDLPFAKLVEELAPERNLSQTPLFQVQLALLAAEGEPLLLPGLALEPLHLEESASKVDLTLRANEGRQGLELVWQFNTDLFDTATIRRLGRHFATLLAAAAADPDLRLAALPLLTPGEEHQILAEWNDTRHDNWTGALHELIAAQARRTPDRPAVSYEGASLTYAELLAAARRLARRLRPLGVGPDVPVAVCADRSLEMVVALLAVLEAGGAYLPLDPAYPADRLAYMLEDAAVPVLLVQEHLRSLLPGSLLPGHRTDPTDPSDPTDRSDLPPGPAVLLLDGVAGPAERLAPHAAAPPPPSPAHPDSLAYVIYTSGSTGRPKGTLSSHRGIVNRLLWMQHQYRLTPDDRVLQKTPFSFDVSVWEFFWPLLTGAHLVIARPGGHQDPAYLVATIAAEKITTLHFVPSMLRVFVDAPGVEKCTSLRRVMASGEALPPEVVRRFHARSAAALHNLYGPTEAAVDVTFHACTREDVAPATIPIGRPVANTRILILDREGAPVPAGVPGELHIGGVQLARGYLARPDLTAERFVPDGLVANQPGARLYRTGDLARLLPDGEVELIGRIDYQVKLRGLRIELGEIEAALAALPGVRDAVVTARTDAGSEARLVAYVAGELSPDAMRTALARTLPAYMLPDALVALEAFPLTPSGKVDRKALPAPEARPELAGEIVPPRTPLEHDLAGLWQDVLWNGLKTETIGVHDNFFQLGGNSISGAVFINRLQERLGEIVHVVTLFDAPTIAQLALHVAAEYPRAVERIWGGETLASHGGAADPQARRVDEALLDGVRALLHRRAPAPPAGRDQDQAKNPPVLFVLSPPRSGSTLLRVMLAGHPRLFAPPELELLHFATLRERRDTFTGRDAFRLEGLPRAVMEARGCDAAEAQALVTAWEDEGMSTRELYRRLQESIGGRLLVDKTPTYGWDPEALREAEAAFDRPLYIHLLRHPYGMIRSFEEARVDQVFFPADQPFARRELAEAVWVLAERNILEHLGTVPADRRLDVRFEDLVRDPDTELRRICAFAGLDYHPAMAEPYRRSSERMTDGLHAESRMLGDVKFHQHSGVDAAAADRWRGWVTEDFLGEPARALAARLGYPLAAGSKASWAAIPRRERADPETSPLPLSFSQERMWFLHELDPESSAYNLCGAVRLRGTLDTAVLERCFAELLRRHESLRTTFGAVDGRPVQVVQPVPSSRSVLSRVDLSRLPAEPVNQREAAATRLASEEESRPFDLLHGPVCRFTLLRLDAEEHALLLTFHHICSDGWSMVILVRELVALYRTFIADEPSPLPELPIQYGDFALWQRATLQGEALEAELGWWRQRLAGELPPLRLPADRRRSSVRGFQALGAGIAIQDEVVRGLHELSRRGSVSLYMTLLAAWKGLLTRLAGETDVVVGAPTANRTRPEVEGLIGFFLNTLVLRTDLSDGPAGSPTFQDVLGRVRETALGAFAHQAVPLQTVLQAAQPDREWAQTTPFQVMFLLQNLPPQESSAPGLTFSPLEADRTIQDLGTAIFEVGLTLDESAAGLSASITYNGFLFDAATIESFLERYHRLLAGVAADPGQPLWSYDLMSAAERSEVLAWGSETSVVAASSFVPVHRAFAARAAADPEAPAVLVPGGGSLTYGELDRRSNQLARSLRALGIGPEAVAGVAIDRSPELIVAVLAVLKAGGAYVPLDPAYPEERLAYILDDAGASVVLTTSTVMAMHPVLAHGGRRAVLLDAEAPALAAQPATCPDVEIDGDNLAYLIYTSGSTGRPKGVMVRHGSLAAYVAGFRAEHGLGPADRVLQFASISFDTSAEEIYPCLTSGAALVLRDDALLGSAPDFLRACGEQGISILDLPTAFWHEMVARLEEMSAGAAAETRIPASLRLVILGGERALPERLAAWHALAAVGGTGGIRLLNTYGPTEATIVATRCELPPGLAISGEVPIGRPVPGGRAFVVDPDRGLAPPGVPGELWLGGSGLARGYLGRPDLTAERFVPDPWNSESGARLYRTGDLVRLLPSGDLEFLGRIDDQVKIRGFRVELREIEAALSRHPDVAEAVVTAREDTPGDRRLAAYVVAREPALPPATSDLRAFLKESLPDYMVPAAFVFLPAFPLTPSGKVDRRSLPEPDRQRPVRDRAYVPPGTPAEETIAAIWCKVLGLDRVSVTDNFFELGGHSLLLPQVLHHLRPAFQVEIPLRTLFAEPTVEGLALAVEELILAEMEAESASGG
jgi:amino acid adenylation domain-containing protein